uniref:C2H2-type domain-containing protein n=1 Tax=Serinus canaria TaxID=9135 RepID=A0A8C9NKJ9_SERCA
SEIRDSSTTAGPGGCVWQEPGELEAAGGTSEHSRKAQLDRLDINVQIDDSYLVEAGDRQKRWQCRMCEKSYTSKYNLVTHILGHNGIKPHSCPHCNKLFKQPSHLQTHLLTHQGTRPHKCGVCSKAFTQTSHLKRHMLLHTDIKPYSCRFCGRGFFSQIHHLKQHSLTHKVGAQGPLGCCPHQSTTPYPAPPWARMSDCTSPS